MGLRTFLGLKRPPAQAVKQPPPIGGIRPRFWRREYRRDFPGGDWTERNRPLFDLAIDYRNKTVLDAGCNLGIIGYEVSKFGPASYHGVDSNRAALEVARAIFSGVSVDHRFDRVDLGRRDVLARTLGSSYDIVLLLRVYGHIVNKHGNEAARRALAFMADRCASVFVATVRGAEEEMTIPAVLQAAGFRVGSVIPPGENQLYGWYLFVRGGSG